MINVVAEQVAVAREQLKRGQPLEAIVTLESVREHHPKSNAANVMMGRALFASGANDAAENVLLREVENRPTSTAAPQLLVHHLVKEGRVMDAEPIVDIVLSHSPHNVKFLRWKLKLAMWATNFPLAIGVAKQLLKNDDEIGEHPDTLLFYGLALLENARMSPDSGNRVEVFAQASKTLKRFASLPGISDVRKFKAAKALGQSGEADYSIELIRQLCLSPIVGNAAMEKIVALEVLAKDPAGKVLREFEERQIAPTVRAAVVPGATRIVFFFSGIGNLHMGGPISGYVQDILTELNCTTVFLNDPNRLLFTNGIPEFAVGFDDAVSRLKVLASELGAQRIFCFGGSAGGYSAIRYGLALGAERVLTMAAPTNISTEFTARYDTRARAVLHRITKHSPDQQHDLRQLIEQCEKPPTIVNYYSQNHQQDAAQAANIDGLVNVQNRMISDSDHHAVILKLIAMKKYVPAIEELVT